MRGLRRLIHRLTALVHKSRTEAELDEEIRFHIEMETQANRRLGMEPREAFRAARLNFGTVEAVKAAYREQGRLPWIEILAQDTLYALRRMARSPGFTAGVVVTLALGIAATSALWSVVDAVLLEPLPYPQPERLTSVMLEREGNVTVNTRTTFEYVRDNARSFSHVAATGMGTGINLASKDTAEYVESLRVSADYFAVLGIDPVRGREFSRGDEARGGPAVAMVSHALWQRHFGGAADIVGASVLLGGAPHTVIGVLPRSYRAIPAAEVWRPLKDDFEGSGTNLHVVARLVPGVSLGQARGELEALSRHEDRPPELRDKYELHAAAYRETLVEGSRMAILVLLGAVAMVLVIACANVACLLLVRASTRGREMALRTAVGGGRRRLIHQLMTESLVLASVGGALGVALAHAGVRGSMALLPGYLDVWQVGVDLRVLGAALVISILTGFVFGVVPAFEATRGELHGGFSEGGGRQAGGRRSAWLRRCLVVTEVTLSTVLLIGAGLLARTFKHLNGVELGFEARGVLTAQMSLEGAGYSERDWFVALYDRTLEVIRALPGVEAAAVGSALPVERGLNLPVKVPDSPVQTEVRSIFYYYVTPDYFDVLGIALLAGRVLDSRDTSGSLPVTLVNQAFVRHYFEGASDAAGSGVVGREIEIAYEDLPDRRIVGVVGDVKDFGLTSGSRPTMYVPVAQVADGLFTVTHRWFSANWLVRLAPGVSESPIGAIRQAVRSVDPRLPFSEFRTMDDVIYGSLAQERFQTVLLGAFAILAVVMAVAGLYALLAFSVARRTREIGVRMALGATGSDTLRLVVREGLALSVAGIALGCVAALGFTRLVESFVFGVSPTDPATYLGGALGFLVVAMTASAVPALKAARLDPVRSLREE